jgi:uncharacterized protein YggU (UPF0235/DUF167 family)
MASITVRVVPRSGRTEVEVGPGGVIVRVRSAPERGRATQEAARALADAFDVAPSRVRLRAGARSRTKTFDVEDMTPEELERRIRNG